jgi:hypothetical protein
MARAKTAPNNSLEPRRSARTFGRLGGLPSILLGLAW